MDKCERHSCLLYNDSDKRFDVIIPFLADGLKNGERVIYTATETPTEELKHRLENAGVDVEKEVREKNLLLMRAEESYLKGGFFSPEKMIDDLRQINSLARKDGRKVRVTGEMFWVLGKPPGYENLMRYEALLNDFFEKEAEMLCAVCQYDLKKFSGDLVIAAMETHPYLVINNKRIKSPLYSKQGLTKYAKQTE